MDICAACLATGLKCVEFIVLTGCLTWILRQLREDIDPRCLRLEQELEDEVYEERRPKKARRHRPGYLRVVK